METVNQLINFQYNIFFKKALNWENA